MGTSNVGSSQENSEVEPLVMSSVVDERTATMTVSIDDEDHKFDVYTSDDGDSVSIEYQETLSWRGQIRISEPRDEVYDVLVRSDEFQEFVAEASNINRV